VTAGIDDREVTPSTESQAPAVPHTLTAIAGEDSIALRWQQEGAVEFWTVYIDPLDGSSSAVYRTTQPRFEITDLPRGDHEIGVMSWRDGVACPGPGVFLMVSVLGAPAGGPAQPENVDATVTASSVDASWDPGDGTGWDARLVAADWTVQQRIDGLPSPWVSFTQLQPNTVYGVQVRARDRDGALSRWSVATWQRTRKVACGHDQEASASSVNT
jgi:hypothetical protein